MPSGRGQGLGAQQGAPMGRGGAGPIGRAGGLTGGGIGRGSAGPIGGRFGGLGALMPGNATSADHMMAQKLMDKLNVSPGNRTIDDLYSNLATAVGKQATSRPLGNFFGGLLGTSYVDPYSKWDGSKNPTPAIDPLGIGIGLAGLPFGIPAGALYTGIKAATGWQGPQLALGGNNIIGSASQGQGPGGMPPGQGGIPPGQGGTPPGLGDGGSGGTGPSTPPPPGIGGPGALATGMSGIDPRFRRAMLLRRLQGQRRSA